MKGIKAWRLRTEETPCMYETEYLCTTYKWANGAPAGGGPGGGCARRPVGIPSPPRGGRWKPRSRARLGTVGG
jgi:hypothetical protein